MFQTISIGFSLLFIPPHAIARECRIADLTNSCQVYAQGEETVNYPDGALSFFGTRGFLRDEDRQRFRQQDQYGRQVSDLLGKIPPGAMSESARQWLLSSQGVIFLNHLEGAQTKSSSTMNIQMPVPLTQENAPLQRVPVREGMTAIRNILSSEDFRVLTTAARAVAALDSRRSALAFARAEAELKARAESRQARADQVVQRAKAAAIENFLNGRTEMQLDEFEKNILSRLKSIEILTGAAAGCGGILTSGGTYDSYSHSIKMCEGANNMPDEELFMVAVHEISHSVDPCATSGPLVRVNLDRIRQRLSQISDDKDTDGQGAMILRALAESKGFAQFYGPDMRNPQVQAMMRDGLVTLVAPALSPRSNPFRHAINCLASAQGGGFPDSNWQSAERGEPVLRCAPDPLNEGFCDWNASAVLGRELSKPDSLLNRMAGSAPATRSPLRVVGSLAGSACVLDPADPSPENRVSLTSEEWEGRTHPPAQLRVENVIFRDPGLRRAFNCRTSAQPACTMTAPARPVTAPPENAVEATR